MISSFPCRSTALNSSAGLTPSARTVSDRTPSSLRAPRTSMASAARLPSRGSAYASVVELVPSRPVGDPAQLQRPPHQEPGLHPGDDDVLPGYDVTHGVDQVVGESFPGLRTGAARRARAAAPRRYPWTRGSGPPGWRRPDTAETRWSWPATVTRAPAKAGGSQPAVAAPRSVPASTSGGRKSSADAEVVEHLAPRARRSPGPAGRSSTRASTRSPPGHPATAATYSGRLNHRSPRSSSPSVAQVEQLGHRHLRARAGGRCGRRTRLRSRRRHRVDLLLPAWVEPREPRSHGLAAADRPGSRSPPCPRSLPPRRRRRGRAAGRRARRPLLAAARPDRGEQRRRRPSRWCRRDRLAMASGAGAPAAPCRPRPRPGPSPRCCRGPARRRVVLSRVRPASCCGRPTRGRQVDPAVTPVPAVGCCDTSRGLDREDGAVGVEEDLVARRFR